MGSFQDILHVVHLVLLVLFCATTTFLLVVTLANRVRVRRVLLTWRPGPARGVPLWPTLFLVVAGVLFAYAAVSGNPVRPMLMLGHLTGGLAWWIAAYLSHTVIVTDFGLVQHVNHRGRAIAWGQIADYFASPERRAERYVFFYLDACGDRHRLDLLVPRSAAFEFSHVVTAKLDARFDYTAKQAYGNTVKD